MDTLRVRTSEAAPTGAPQPHDPPDPPPSWCSPRRHRLLRPPPPADAADAAAPGLPRGRRASPAPPDLARQPDRLYYATNRLPVGPRDDRVYTVAPDRRLHLGTATLRIGDESATLVSSTSDHPRRRPDRPFLHLNAWPRPPPSPRFEPPDPDARALFAQIDAALAASRSRDILVYVHGANTAVSAPPARPHSSGISPAARRSSLLYVWPTAENFLRYPRDIETAFGGAPHLAEFLDLLATAHRRREQSTSSPTAPAPHRAATPSPASPASDPAAASPPRRD